MSHQRLLLATDGSLPALAATIHAIQLAQESGAELHAVYVRPPESERQVEFAEIDLELLEAGPVNGLEVARHLGLSSGVRVHAHELHGPIIDAIGDAARRIDVGVVIAGESRTRPVPQSAAQSVSESLRSRFEDIPVILVPGLAEEVIPVMRKLLHEVRAGVSSGASAEADVNWSEASRHPSFRALISAKTRFLVPAIACYLVFYLGLTLLAGFAPDFMAREVIGAVNVGYLLIFATYALVWILAVVYVRVANNTFDPNAATAIESLYRKEDGS